MADGGRQTHPLTGADHSVHVVLEQQRLLPHQRPTGHHEPTVGREVGAAGLDAVGLGQLKDYASQAGDLGKTIGGFKDQVSVAAANPLGAISSQLGKMGGFDVDALKSLPGGAQLDAVKGFASSASGVGSATSEFLKAFGG